MSETPKPLSTDDIRELIQAETEPRRFGPNFDALVEAIDWELRAQLALGRIGPVDATDEQRHRLAYLIADEVDWRFRLELKRPPEQDRDASSDGGEVSE